MRRWLGVDGIILLTLLAAAAAVYVARGRQDSGLHLLLFLVLDIAYLAATRRSRG